MNTKKQSVIILLFLVTFSAVAQFPGKDIRNLLSKDPSISKDFTNKVIKTGKLMICDWDKDPCQDDLCDPWDERPCSEQIMSVKQKFDKDKKAVEYQDGSDFRQQQLTQIMKHFEQALLKGAGGKIISKKQVLNALKKYPGYKLNAMRLRYNTYVKMECFPAK